MHAERSKLVRAGMVVAIATLIVPILWPVAVVIGVLVLNRTEHQKQGGIILLLGAGILPLVGGLVWLAFVVGAYRAPSESMLPNVELGNRFVILKLGYEPRVGDIAVFTPPIGSEAGEQCGEPPARGAMCSRPTEGEASVKFIKRIVAGPGDRIRMEKGRLIRNGRPESGYELGECEERAMCDYPMEIVVPDGHFFVLGDNRGASQDSRFWGPVPAERFEGRKLFTYWPG